VDSVVLSNNPYTNTKAFYNSSTRALHISYLINEPVTFNLYNLLGQQELSSPITTTAHEANIALNQLPAGIYIASFINPKGKVLWRQKVWVEH
jgi:hypothetical protein